jgi:hypothetical protein
VASATATSRAATLGRPVRHVDLVMAGSVFRERSADP